MNECTHTHNIMHDSYNSFRSVPS